MNRAASFALLCTAACSAQQAVTLTIGSDTYTGTLTKKVAAAPTKPATPPATPKPVSTTAVYPSGLPMGIFGSSYPLNQAIDKLPVDTRLIATSYGANLSAATTDTVDASARTSPNGSSIYGLVVTPNFPLSVTNSVKHPEQLVNVTYAPLCPTCDLPYVDESDSIDPNYTGPNGEKRTRLIPVRDAVIEGASGKGGDGDSHMTVPDLATMRDYELYGTKRAADGSLTAVQVTVWDMLTGKRISDSGCDKKFCTSATAAGTPRLASMLRYEEMQYAIDHNLPDVGHAIAVTVKWSRQGMGGSPGWFVPPATHAAGNGGSPFVMGTRMRIPASLTKPTGLSAYDNILWNTLAKYGMTVDDNGGTGYLIGDQNTAWGNHNFSIPSGVLMRQMEVVNTGCWVNARGTTDNTGILGTPCQSSNASIPASGAQTK